MGAIRDALGPFTDAQMPQLYATAKAQRVTVNVNATARLFGRPCIELRGGDSLILLASFETAAEAIEWLQPGEKAVA